MLEREGPGRGARVEITGKAISEGDQSTWRYLESSTSKRKKRKKKRKKKKKKKKKKKRKKKRRKKEKEKKKKKKKRGDLNVLRSIGVRWWEKKKEGEEMIHLSAT